MNSSYLRIIAASNEDRRDLFVAAARRLGTAEQNVEKDFWVCWILDLLFHYLPEGGPRLLFKGGTSLSKAFGLINRFSEDIDITVFRQDLGVPSSLEELEALSGKKRKARLKTVRETCQTYINETLRAQLGAVIAETLRAADHASDAMSILADDMDPEHETLTFRYPSVITSGDSYVAPSVRIEAGARSALDPCVAADITPYIASDLPGNNLLVDGIRTIEPKLTFWEKILILHGLRRWYERRRELYQKGNRVTRHYFDVHSLVHSQVGHQAEVDLELGKVSVRHTLVFFLNHDMDHGSAVPGTFALIPTAPMIDGLRKDYARMEGMIIGDVPSFDDIMASIGDLERRLNHPQ